MPNDKNQETPCPLQIAANSRKITRRKNTTMDAGNHIQLEHIYLSPPLSPDNNHHCVFDEFVDSFY